MPQLDLHSYFSATTTLIILFLSLIFILHTYFLPKLATCLKFRKKFENLPKVVKVEDEILYQIRDDYTGEDEDAFLELTEIYINEMETIIKNLDKK